MKPAIAAVLTMACGLARAQDAPPQRPVDLIPPAWTTFAIQWKADWNQTLAANTEKVLQRGIAGNKRLTHAASKILLLRRIELHKAMIKRFGGDKAKHADAYRAIALNYHQLGMRWQSSYWAWKITREFPGRKDLLPDAYRLMLSWKFGAGSDPDAAHWEFAVFEAMALAENGTIPQKHPAFALACDAMRALMAGRRRYDVLAAQLRRLEKLGAESPAARRAAGSLLRHYGHLDKAVALGQGSKAYLPTGEIVALPRSSEMETRMTALIGGMKLREPGQGVSPRDVQPILDLSVRTDAYARRSEMIHAPFAAAVEQMLRSLPPEDLRELRAAQDQAARPTAMAARLGQDRDALVQASRRYPWARSLHVLLVDSGERDLLAGRRHWAMASFRDVIDHADDADLLAAAHVGLWTALAQDGASGRALAEATAAVADNVPLPWRGRRVPAGQLKRAFSRQAPLPKSTALSKLRRRRILLPQPFLAAQQGALGPRTDYGLHAPWPLLQVQSAGPAVLAIGNGHVSRFEAGSDNATWLHVPDTPAESPWSIAAAGRYRNEQIAAMSFDRRPVTVRAGRAAAVSDDRRRVYVLSGGADPAIEAIDVGGGAGRWTTATDPTFQTLTPMSHPSAADGRVYVLAVSPALVASIRPGLDRPGMWYLVCLRGRNGQLLWKRPLGWQQLTVLDLARGSAGVTVHNGAVYCSTNMGIVARCDPRDGTVKWIRGYPSLVNPSPDSPNLSREGSSPLVAGKALLLAPRDHNGVMALDVDTGKTLWTSTLLPSDRMVGVAGSVLIAADERTLAGLDIRSGRVLWRRELPEGGASQSAVVGPDVVVVSGGLCFRIDVRTGKTAEQTPLNDGMATQRVVLDDGTLLSVAAAEPPGPAEIIAQPAAGIRLPLEEVRTLGGREPLLLRPGGPTGETLCIMSGHVLIGATTTPTWRVAWQRFLDQPSQQAVVAEGQLLVAAGNSVRAIDATSGVVRWSTPVAFPPYRLAGGASLVYAAAARNRPTVAAVIDAASGKRLWSRSFSSPVRTGGSPETALLRVESPGGPTLRLQWARILFADTGAVAGEMVVDARTGTVRKVRPLPADQRNWSHALDYQAQTSRFIGRGMWVHVQTLADTPGAAAGWDRWLDWTARGAYPASYGLDQRPDGLYLRACGQLFQYDVKTRRETVFNLPGADRPLVHVIFAHRVVGETVVIVSGVTGEVFDPYRRGGRLPYVPAHSRVYVDIFDRETAGHLGRQELTGIGCYDPKMTGYRTQAEVFDGGIVVSAPDGVHVFRVCPKAAASYAAAASRIRELDKLVRGGGVPAAEIISAAAKANAAVAVFARASAAADVSEVQREQTVKSLTDRIAAVTGRAVTPVMTPAPGAYVSSPRVTLTVPAGGARIRYTLDGTDPAATGQPYRGPINVGQGKLIRAVAAVPGIAATSAVVEGAYEVLPAVAAENAAGLKAGLRWTYRSGKFSHATQVPGKRAHKSGISRNFDISPWYGGDGYGVSFSGYLRIPADGVYTFYLTSDDGSRLLIGKKALIDNGRHHPMQMVQGRIGLRAGVHPIQIDYFEEVGGEGLIVEYEGPGLSRRRVPDSALLHR